MDKSKILEQIIDLNRAAEKNNKYFSLGQTASNHLFFIDKPGLITTLKEFFKKWPGLYYFLISTFSSVYYEKRLIKAQIKEAASLKKIVINLGSGNKSLAKQIINVDLCAYPDVDVVADAVYLPFKDGVADLVISEVTMEHLPNEEIFLTEANRVTVSGGKILIVVPFIFPYHASPHDYNRWTAEGLRALLERHGFQVLKLDIASGPASALTGVLVWFLAIALSFGFKIIYEFWFIFFSLTLWPIKYLDLLLNHLPMAKDLAANFTILAKKA